MNDKFRIWRTNTPSWAVLTPPRRRRFGAGFRPAFEPALYEFGTFTEACKFVAGEVDA